MEKTARLKFIRVSPRKARLVVDQIRGLSAEDAKRTLRLSNKSIAPAIEKLLDSAIANAEDQEGADVDELTVSKAIVNEGPRMKRLRPAPMGRGFRYVHRLAHIELTVSDGQSGGEAEDEE